MAISPGTISAIKLAWEKKEYVVMIVIGLVAAITLLSMLFVYMVVGGGIQQTFEISPTAMIDTYNLLSSNIESDNFINEDHFTKMISVGSVKTFCFNEGDYDAGEVYDVVLGGNRSIRGYLGDEFYQAYNNTYKLYRKFLNELLEKEVREIKHTDYIYDKNGDPIKDEQGNYETDTDYTYEYYLHKNFVFPVGGQYSYVNDWYNPRESEGSGVHQGTDIIAERGTPILSVLDGRVEKEGWSGVGGWMIYIKANNDVYLYYAHMNERSSFRQGNTVTKGQTLGYVGNSGGLTSDTPVGTNDASVPHLHFGIRINIDGNTTWINPYNFLRFFQ